MAPGPNDTTPNETTRLRLGAGRTREAMTFHIEPDRAARERLAEVLDLSAIRKLRFAGRLTPTGRQDWKLDADLGATIVQPCGITLAPVTARIDEAVTRRYLAAFDPGALPVEQEMPEDDSKEPLPAVLDLESVMAEALSLAVPPFPRAEGAGIGAVETADPGAEPITEEDTKPFAGLRDALKGRPH